MAIRWYVAQTRARGEVLAKQHLERQSFRTFLPRIRRITRHARRAIEAKVPLFPGYIFVAFDNGVDRWRSINSTHGVKTLVTGDGGAPTPVRPGVMRKLCDACDGDLFMGSADVWVPGQVVRIEDGPFAETLARVENLEGPDRVRVLFALLGSSVSMTLPSYDLRPA
ncbi:transcription termination/antitermination protein NusG [Croceicoccus bisphenolivorans]|uniref:transcription termination/antitermination protein NusG n=1 Tax=Croceicoccus bisphenolivorans TaxID=1783232 RepID=UPI00082E6B5A|nr:transcription termination/antitermination NusG family protein [Croceicoccus bisphenolivorans]